MNVLLTGGSGFVGRGVLERLAAKGEHTVLAALRSASSYPGLSDSFIISELSGATDWHSSLLGQEVVIHAAARVHVMKESCAEPLEAFREVNVRGTLRLAEQAARAGVRRFIFISSIKVNGEGTLLGEPYDVFKAPDPLDPYGISKREAEEGLRILAAETGMEVVIIRPVLVYGPMVKANFRNMMKWVYRGMPLPFGAIHNKRSFVALDNLVDLIYTCIDHPAAANQTFLVSDGKDLSLTELLRELGGALNKPARLVPVPVRLIERGLQAMGKHGVAQRLCGNLQVDISHTCETLGWRPPVSVRQGLQKTADAYLKER